MEFILKLLQNIDNFISYILSNNSKENIFLKLFFKKKKINLFDIGANLGSYTDYVNKELNIDKAYLFEPSIICKDYLKKKYKEKNFFILNVALSKKNGVKSFFENKVLSQSSLYLKKNNFNKNLNNYKKYKINCLSLDNFYKKLEKKINIDLLKIDAEGEDLNILKGSVNLLKNKKINLIKIELINKTNKKKKKSNISEIINFMEKYGYFLKTISKTKFHKENLIMLDAYFSHKN